MAILGEISTCTPAELQAIIRDELAANRQLIASGQIKLGS